MVHLLPFGPLPRRNPHRPSLSPLRPKRARQRLARSLSAASPARAPRLATDRLGLHISAPARHPRPRALLLTGRARLSSPTSRLPRATPGRVLAVISAPRQPLDPHAEAGLPFLNTPWPSPCAPSPHAAAIPNPKTPRPVVPPEQSRCSAVATPPCGIPAPTSLGPVSNRPQGASRSTVSDPQPLQRPNRTEPQTPVRTDLGQFIIAGVPPARITPCAPS